MRGAGVLILIAALVPRAFAQPSNKPDLFNCLSSIGVPAADRSEPWTAGMTLTVSERGDASKITFDADAASHVSYLVFSVLARMRFSEACTGKQMYVRVRWRPAGDWSYGVSVKGNTLVLTGIPVNDRSSSRHGGPLEIGSEDLEQLRGTPSLQDFLFRKGFITRRLR